MPQDFAKIRAAVERGKLHLLQRSERRIFQELKRWHHSDTPLVQICQDSCQPIGRTMTHMPLHAQANKVGICTATNNRQSQCQRLLWLLKMAADAGLAYEDEPWWVPLPKILDLRIANYRARISELRKQGHVIELKDEWVNGQRRTAYRLVREKNGN